MRLLIFGLFIFLPLAGTQAQDLKGKNAIGAVAHATILSDEDGDEYLSMWTNPTWVHFYSDQSAWGAGVSYNYYRTTFAGERIGFHQFMLYPYWRHHYPFNEKTGIFIRAEAGVGYARQYEYVDDIERYNEWNLFTGARAGAYHFLTDRLSLELNWGDARYSHTIAKHSYGTGHKDALNLDLSFSSVSVGLLWYLK
ncbi:hypothetical protein K1X84_00110 [bacterium]|nr:hypothetical protein [bacterium]